MHPGGFFDKLLHFGRFHRKSAVDATIRTGKGEMLLHDFGSKRDRAEGDADAAKKLPMFTGIQHLLLVLLLILMIWKPGL